MILMSIIYFVHVCFWWWLYLNIINIHSLITNGKIRVIKLIQIGTEIEFIRKLFISECIRSIKCYDVAVLMETGSRVASRWSSRPWPRSWRPTLRCMCWESVSGRRCSSTPPSPLSRTSPRRTTENSSLIRSSGKCILHNNGIFFVCGSLYIQST